MGRLKLAVIVFTIIAVSYFLLKESNNSSSFPIQIVDLQDKNQTAPTVETAAIEAVRATDEPFVINDRADFFGLVVGQKFSVQANAYNDQIPIVLAVISKRVTPSYTLLTASSEPGFTSVITVTDKLTNILITTSTDTYEYIGEDFRGVVDRIRDLNLQDEMHLLDSK
jgi:uncharacterized protein (UPF0333 family)